MTSGSKAFKSLELISTPSNTIKTPVASPKVDLPRIQKSAPSAPGCPLRCIAITPAIRPAKLVLKLEEGTFNSAGRTCWIDPTIVSFFCVAPNAVTTTSYLLSTEQLSKNDLLLKFPESHILYKI